MGFLSEIKKVFTKEYREETKRQEAKEVFLKNNVDKFKFSGDNYDVHETIDRLKKAEAQTEFKQKQVKIFNIVKEEQRTDIALFVGNNAEKENFKNSVREINEHDEEER